MCIFLARCQVFLFGYIAALAPSQGISSFGFHEEKILPSEFLCDGVLMRSRMFLRSVSIFCVVKGRVLRRKALKPGSQGVSGGNPTPALGALPLTARRETLFS